jgi:hypothetical protein
MRMLVPVEAKSTQKRGLSVIGRSTAPQAAASRPAGGLLGALRGKRAS